MPGACSGETKDVHKFSVAAACDARKRVRRCLSVYPRLAQTRSFNLFSLALREHGGTLSYDQSLDAERG